MRTRFLGVLLLVLSMGLAASAQTPTPDQLQALKDLTPEQQNAILQGVKGNGTGKKTDPRLKTPETVQPSSDQFDNTRKTRDGRILRQTDEDPELRPDDSVMIEMISLQDLCGRNRESAQNFNANRNGSTNANNSINGINGSNGNNAENLVSGTSGTKNNSPYVGFDFS